MNKLFAWLGVALCILPFVAHGGEIYASGPTHLTLHVDMRLGATNRLLSPPIFGLSLEREVAHSAIDDRWDGRRSYGLTTSLIELQFTRFGAQGVRVGGANIMSYSDQESVWRSPWLWVGIGAGALLISCAADNFPCGGSSHMGPSSGY